ncbi:MAG: NAD(P)H-dependent oxidoreductase [Desulfosarcinaceae bacterium]
MLAVGIQGSPRKKGNSDILLTMFMQALADMGIQTRILQVTALDIVPCKELTVCEKKGICPIDDVMSREIYGLLRQADLVVAASPVFFYNVSAQLKALIDRCQTLWARRYMLKLKDPGSPIRRGFLLAVGATGGQQLFNGMHLTAKYFFDALGAAYSGSLTYRRVESRGQIKSQPNLEADVTRSAAELAAGLTGRTRVMFVCRENACRSQMAAAFARFHGGSRLDVISAGSRPAEQINGDMVMAMAEKGIDMGFGTTRSLDEALAPFAPQKVISMGCGEQCPEVPGAEFQEWQLPDPAGQSMDIMRSVRDEIEARVLALIDN